MPVTGRHFVLGTPIEPPFPENMELALVGLGCFWGAERIFWKTEGVHTTAVGYAGGYTPNPTYEEVCSGRTGHNEVVRVVFDPAVTSYENILRLFWEGHDPTQGMRQGNDVGTQYRSGIYTYSDAQREIAESTRDAYQQRLTDEAATARSPPRSSRRAPSTTPRTTTSSTSPRCPNGYCGLGGTGVTCPVGVVPPTEARPPRPGPLALEGALAGHEGLAVEPQGVAVGHAGDEVGDPRDQVGLGRRGEAPRGARGTRRRAPAPPRGPGRPRRSRAARGRRSGT